MSERQGLLGGLREYMTPERSLAFQGLGMGLSQLAYGKPVDLSPVHQALGQRQQERQMRAEIEGSGIMDRFTPQQRSVLAAMPQELAMKIIMGEAFQQPADPITLSAGATLFDPNTGQPIYTAPSNDTTLRQNVEWLVERGFPVEQAVEMVRGGVNLSVNTGSEVGSIPAGYELFTDPDTGGRSMRAIPGGPADQAAALAEDQEAGRKAQRARAGATVVQDLQRALDLLPELGPFVGNPGVIGGLARAGSAQIPGSLVNRITQFTESALSNVGLDTLQQMRENSPTGGALGQVPIQQQRRLEQVLGSLDVTQPPDVLEANIKRVINIYTDIIYGSAAERERAVQQGRMTRQQSDEIESYYFDLPFDERGRPVQGRGETPAGQAGSSAQSGTSRRLRLNPVTGQLEEVGQ